MCIFIYIHIYIHIFVTIIIKEQEAMSFREMCENTQGVRRKRWRGNDINTVLICELLKKLRKMKT